MPCRNPLIHGGAPHLADALLTVLWSKVVYLTPVKGVRNTGLVECVECFAVELGRTLRSGGRKFDCASNWRKLGKCERGLRGTNVPQREYTRKGKALGGKCDCFRRCDCIVQVNADLTTHGLALDLRCAKHVAARSLL